MLSYNYHDAGLQSIHWPPANAVTLIFSLYPIDYPAEPKVAVSMEGIFNFTALKKFLAPVDKELAAEPGEAIRCNALKCHAQKSLGAAHPYFHLDLDGFGRFRIHCTRLSENRV